MGVCCAANCKRLIAQLEERARERRGLDRDWTDPNGVHLLVILSLNPVTVENDATKANPSRNDRDVSSMNKGA